MSVIEEFTVAGNKLVDKVKKLVHEGNVRKIRLIHKGNVIFEVPISVGIPVAALGIILTPLLAAVAAVAAIITECTIQVERVGEPKNDK